MPLVNSHYEGTEARQIRQFTKREVEKAIIRAVESIEGSSGANGIAIVKSLATASNRLQAGKRFVAYVPSEPETRRCRVLGDDSRAHQGMEFSWKFLLQMSNGRVGGDATGDATVTSDDALVDAVRDGLESQYAYFRDTLGFSNLQVEQADKVTPNGSALNPLTVFFTNRIRLAVDAFIVVPNP